MFVVLEWANRIYYTIVIKSKLDFRKSTVSFRENGNNKVQKQNHVHDDDDAMENDSDLWANLEGLVDVEIPSSKTGLDQQDQSVRQTWVFLKLTKQ